MSKRIINLEQMKRIIDNKEVVKAVEVKYTDKCKKFDRITTSQEKTKKIFSDDY